MLSERAELYSISSYGNDENNDTIFKIKEIKNKNNSRLKSSLEHCITTRNITLLKYHDLAFIINMIQISVIIVSTCITCFETLRTQIGITDKTHKILSVSSSTYIALIVSISRFLKYDEKKESFSKLSDRWNQLIIKVRSLRSDINSIDSYTLTVTEAKEKLALILEDKSYMVDISQLDNEVNTMINVRESTYYRNILMNMRLEYEILERHKMLFDFYRKGRSEVGMDSNLDKYRCNWCPPFCPFPIYTSNYDKFFKDMERTQRSKDKFKKHMNFMNKQHLKYDIV